MAQDRPIRFRAVHTKNGWRKASHTSIRNALYGSETNDTRSAIALFKDRNPAINSEHGQPLYVVVWDSRKNEDGRLVKPDPNNPNRLKEVFVSIYTILEWERQKGLSIEDAERFFNESSMGMLADVDIAHTSSSDSEVPGTQEKIEAELQARIQESRLLSSTERRRRLELAAKKPERIVYQTTGFVRNSDVIVEVLERAKGRCEECGQPAPFVRARDGTPYLEVHHRIPLSHDGLDTVENAIAVCPNCHRWLHYGNA